MAFARMSAKVLKKCDNLIDIGIGVASRVFYCGSNIPSDILSNPAIAKVLQRVEKKFPELRNMEKAVGYEVFVEMAPELTKDLSSMGYLLRDVADYSTASADTINELHTCLKGISSELDFISSKEYCMRLLSLLSLHIKVITIFHRIHADMKRLYGLYVCAYEVVKGRGQQEPHLEKIAQLFTLIENRHRYFVDTFTPFTQMVGEIMEQLNDSITQGNDLGTIRNKALLNPLNAGESMEVPSRQTLNAVKDICLFDELNDHHLYCEYVLYMFLACPGLLFNPTHFDIFRTVASEYLSIRLMKGLTLNIHAELDAMSQVTLTLTLTLTLNLNRNPNPEP